MNLTQLERRVRARRSLPDPRAAKALRVDAGVTIAELAQLVGVSPRSDMYYEAGTRRPRGATLEAYAGALATIRRELV
jgi:transcriptional regulator with XRE-family HTH domain